MDGGCVSFYNCECVFSNLLIASRKARFVAIDTRVSASRKPRISRRTALFSLLSLGFSTQTRCARRAAYMMDRIRERNALALGTPFRRSTFLASRNWQQKKVGQHVHRIRSLSVHKVARCGYAKFASQNCGSERCENEAPAIATRQCVEGELKSPCLEAFYSRRSTMSEWAQLCGSMAGSCCGRRIRAGPWDGCWVARR